MSNPRLPWLNYDLFGNVVRPESGATPVEVKLPTHVSVFHSSESETPPHIAEYPREERFLSSNGHPDIVHMGTLGSATERLGRQFVHEYRIPKTLMDPVWADSDSPTNANEEWYVGPQQLSIFESEKARPQQALSRNVVVPYRNQFEDKGSISYMVPKHLIKPGRVEFVGTTSHKTQSGSPISIPQEVIDKVKGS